MLNFQLGTGCIIASVTLFRNLLGGFRSTAATTPVFPELLRIGLTPATAAFLCLLRMGLTPATLGVSRPFQVGFAPAAIAFFVLLWASPMPDALAFDTPPIGRMPLRDMTSTAGLSCEIAREPSRQGFLPADYLGHGSRSGILFFLKGLSESSMHGAFADAETPGDLPHAEALSVKGSDLIGFGASGWPPTFVFALGLCPGDALALALQHHLALELSDARQHIEHELARGRAGIDAHGEDAEPDPLSREALDDLAQMPCEDTARLMRSA